MLIKHLVDKTLSFWGLSRVKYSITAVNDNGREEPILTFDTIEEFSLNASTQTTSYPIESGYRVVDYKYTNPTTINIKGIISRSSACSLGVVTNPLIRDKKQMISSMEDKLELLKQNMILVNIRGRSGRVRENYTLKSYSISEQIDNYYLFVVEMVFVEVKTPKGETTQIERSSTINVGHTATKQEG